MRRQSLRMKISQGVLSVEEVLKLALGIVKELEPLHQKNQPHGQLHPSSVFVSGESGEYKVEVAKPVENKDLGFERDARIARYLAPEQTGVINEIPDARADLYTLGMILYESISGTCPIDEDDISGVLRKQVTKVPLSLVHKERLIPRSLEELIFRLISINPADRYHSLSAVKTDLVKLMRLMENGELDPSFVLGKADFRKNLVEPAFIGRRAELHELQKWTERARKGKGCLVFLESESGGGKTRLLEEFARRNLFLKTWTLGGQALDQAAKRPFQVLVGVARAISSHLEKDHELRQALKSRLGNYLHGISIALPELKSVLTPMEKEAQGPEGFGQMRTLQALTLLLNVLGNEKTPALILLDDCQWADEFTLRLLRYWVDERNRDNSNPSYTMIVLAFRSEEIEPDHPLREIVPHCDLLLPKLDAYQVKELVSSMAGKVPAEIPSLVTSLSLGNPFMASAVVRGLVESGGLYSSNEGWRIESEKMDYIQSSDHAADFLVRRLQLLPPETLRFLSTGALLGKVFEIPLAMALTEQAQSTVDAAIEDGTLRHILWVDSLRTTCNFVHDKIRESLLGRLSPEERQGLHIRAAEYLEQNEKEHIFDIAFHFDAAGCPSRALSYAMQAAETARAQYSLELAELQYRIAERGLDSDSSPTRKAVLEGLGEVYLLRGNYDEAEKRFQTAISLAGSHLEMSRIEGKLGEVEFKRGNVERAANAIERGLRSLGVYVPQRTAVASALALREALVQIFHTYLPSFFVGRRKNDPLDEKEFTIIRLLCRLMYVYWFQKGKVFLAWAHFKGVNMVEKYGTTPELAQAYSEHAAFMSLIPNFNRAARYAEKGLRIRKDRGDLWGQGQSLHFYGVSLYAASRFEECIAKCTEAARLLDRMGDKWEVHIAGFHHALSLYRLGRLKEATDLFRSVYSSGKYIGDHQAMALNVSGWSKASHGRVSESLIQTEVDRKNGDLHTRLEVLQGKAICLLAQGKTEDARKLLTETAVEVRKSGIQSEYVASVFPCLATAIRKELENAKQELVTFRYKELMKQYGAVTNEALSFARKFKNNLPHALRERALYLARQNRLRSAFRLLKRSEDTARDQKAKYELLQTLATKKRLATELKEDVSADISSEIQNLTEFCGVGPDPLGGSETFLKEKKPNLSLIDRFDAVIQEGRSIVGALTQDDIFKAGEKACHRLLRPETYLLLKWSALKKRMEPVEGITPNAYSEEMIQQAMKSKKAFLYREGDDHRATTSLSLLGVKSALLVPILTRKKIAACFYLAHHQVGNLFGEEELRISEFVATLMGAALENAEGFSQLRQRMEEQRAVERQLTQYAFQLEKSNSELEQFAYVASHDLKEPLRMVTSFVQLLDQEHQKTGDQKSQQYSKYVVEGAMRMAELIDGLLFYSRIGVKENERLEVDFNKVAETAIKNLSLVIEDTGATVTYDRLPVVWGEFMPLVQLVQNLIGNALKFHGASPPRIHLKAELTGSDWRFAISDNGIGIESPYLERIFVIFQRLHKREEFPGTGIGLAICKKTVQHYGGRIWVESKVGVGSTFYFTLPVPTQDQRTRKLRA